MNIIYRILFIVIAICIPAVCVLSALNIVFRMPDLYIYELNRNQIANEIDLGISDDELGEFFSDFMTGKEDDFDLFTEYKNREQSVFGTAEQINMENSRRLLDLSLYILGGAAFLTVLSCCVLLAKKMKQELRLAFKFGIIVQAITLVASHAALYFGQSRDFLYSFILPLRFGADDVLPLMLTGHFVNLGLVAISVVSLVILAILASVLWRLTKPRRMFYRY